MCFKIKRYTCYITSIVTQITRSQNRHFVFLYKILKCLFLMFIFLKYFLWFYLEILKSFSRKLSWLELPHPPQATFCLKNVKSKNNEKIILKRKYTCIACIKCMYVLYMYEHIILSTSANVKYYLQIIIFLMECRYQY